MNPAIHQRICAEIQERHQREMAAVVLQRDELRRVLVGVETRCNESGYVGRDGQYLKMIRATIAKVGADTTATEGHNVK